MRYGKILCACLSLMTFMCMCHTNFFAQESILYGDADMSGRLTSNDAALIEYKVNNKDYMLPIEYKTADYMEYLDVNSDSQLSAADASYVYQKVLDSELVLPVETDGKIRLAIEKTGWAYPNVAFWSLANYPDTSEHTYIVTLYKNGVKVDDYTVTAEPSSKDGIVFETGRVGAHIDFTDVIGKDVSGVYTFSVKAIGDNISTLDSDIVTDTVPYIYNDPEKGDNAVSVASDGTIQIKVNNIPLPYQWIYSVDNDNIELVSESFAPEYNAYYDDEPIVPGAGTCFRYNYKPVKSGETVIKFEYVSLEDSEDILDSKTVRLKINEDLSVSIAENVSN